MDVYIQTRNEIDFLFPTIYILATDFKDRLYLTLHSFSYLSILFSDLNNLRLCLSKNEFIEESLRLLKDKAILRLVRITVLD